jgi:NADPH-dependent 2,4-dienoyl-CoA reductase/sulfur reductase-like enzyme
MKKLFSFLLCVAFAAVTFAQDAVLLPLAAGDTIVNTGTSSKVLIVTSGPSGVYLQAIFNKISGATVAGTAQLMGSLDGTNYTNIGSAYTITNVTTQNAVFSVAAPVPKYLKILNTGSGTESVQVRYYYRAPKYQSP